MTRMLPLRALALPVVLAGMSLIGCSDEADNAATSPTPDAGSDLDPDPEFDLYPQSELLQIDITLDEDEWAALKQQGRSINDVFSGCTTEAFAYTKYKASVRVGKHSFDNVSVRKKGYLGSISTYRPSLRIDLDEFVHDQSLGGSKAITLNNSNSDRSYAAQCLSYAQFAAAGIPAPRCGFAEVHVNGESLGVYVSVEPVKKPFLRDHFGNDEGDLYEGGGGSDFRADLLKNLEKKTNEDEPAAPELQALADALLLPDDQLLPALEPLLDVDEFLRFWAVETLVAHWDGYSGDLNNFFVYIDPAKGRRLRFIPWGTDNAYEDRHPFLPVGEWPRSAYAWSRLPRRLYALEETRTRYRAILREELSEHWDEAALNAKIDAMAGVAKESVDLAAVETLHKFIDGRRTALMAELDTSAKPWSIDERLPAQCRPDAQSSLSVSFNTTWGDLASTTAFVNTASGKVQGTELKPMYVIAAAGSSVDPAAPGKALRITVGNPDGSFTLFQFQLGVPTLTPGELKLHGFEVFGYVLTGATKDGMVKIQTVGFIGKGSITFDAIGTNMGDVVKGHLETEIVSLPPAQPAMTSP